MSRYKETDLVNALPTYTGGSGNAGVRGDIIKDTVSIDDVNVVLTGNSNDLGTLCKKDNINKYSAVRPYKSKALGRYYTVINPQSKPNLFLNIKYDINSSSNNKTTFLKPIYNITWDSDDNNAKMTGITFSTDSTKFEIPDTYYKSGDILEDENYGWFSKAVRLSDILRILKFDVILPNLNHFNDIIDRLNKICWYFNKLDSNDGYNLYRLTDFDCYKHNAKKAVVSNTDYNAKNMYLGAMGNNVNRVNFIEVFADSETLINYCFPNKKMYYIDNNNSRQSIGGIYNISSGTYTENSCLSLIAISLYDTNPTTSTVVKNQQITFNKSEPVNIVKKNSNNIDDPNGFSSYIHSAFVKRDNQNSNFVTRLALNSSNPYRIIGIIHKKNIDVDDSIYCVTLPNFLSFLKVSSFENIMQSVSVALYKSYIKDLFGIDITISTASGYSSVDRKFNIVIEMQNYTKFYFDTYEIALRMDNKEGAYGNQTYNKYYERTLITSPQVLAPIGKHTNPDGGTSTTGDFIRITLGDVGLDGNMDLFNKFYYGYDSTYKIHALNNDVICNGNTTPSHKMYKATGNDSSEKWNYLIRNWYQRAAIIVRIYFSKVETSHLNEPGVLISNSDIFGDADTGDTIRNIINYDGAGTGNFVKFIEYQIPLGNSVIGRYDVSTETWNYGSLPTGHFNIDQFL